MVIVLLYRKVFTSNQLLNKHMFTPNQLIFFTSQTNLDTIPYDLRCDTAVTYSLLLKTFFAWTTKLKL